MIILTDVSRSDTLDTPLKNITADLPKCPKPGDPPVYIIGHRLHCLEGNMSGIKVLVPSYYLESYPEYDGRNWLSDKPLNLEPTFANAMTDLGLLIRATTLRPVVTEQDFADKIQSGKKAVPYYYETWVSVDVHAESKYLPKDGTYLGFKERALTTYFMQAKFEKKPDMYGLEFYKLTPTPEDVIRDSYNHGEEVYFDNNTNKDIILCKILKPGHDKYGKELPISHCNYHFLMDKPRVSVDVSFASNSLDRWREIKSGVEFIIKSFIQE